MQGKFIHFKLIFVTSDKSSVVNTPVGLVIDYHKSAVFLKGAVNITLNDNRFFRRIAAELGIYIPCPDAYGDLLFPHKQG